MYKEIQIMKYKKFELNFKNVFKNFYYITMYNDIKFKYTKLVESINIHYFIFYRDLYR